MHHGGYDQRMLSGLDGTAGGIDASAIAEGWKAGISGADRDNMEASELYMEVYRKESDALQKAFLHDHIRDRRLYGPDAGRFWA